MKRLRKQGGFTLIETISVLVILGVLAAVGSHFLVTTVDAYSLAEKRAKLLVRGRASIEQMTRQLRLAVPNSLRVSPSGACVEFLPLVAGGNYLNALPDSENSAPASASIATAPIISGLGSANHVIVGGLSANEIYSGASPSARVGFGAFNGAPATQITLASSHRFIRNSPTRRVFVSDNPKRFCVQASSLLEYSNYGLDAGSLDDSNPGGVTTLMALNVSAAGNAFILSPGSEDRNASIAIALNYSSGDEVITLNQTVLVRNVP